MTAVSGTSRAQKPIRLWAFALIIGGLLVLFITFRVFDGTNAESWDAFVTGMTSIPDWQNIILVNLLVGMSVALFVIQLRWGALRVTLTVAVALLFGYLVTFLFSLDTAERFTQGEFTIALISDAPVIENDSLDLAYGERRGGEFNIPDAREPLREVAYAFEGRAGDMITALAFAANRRSTVDMQIALIDADGEMLIDATGASPEQIERFGDDLRSESDAIIEAFTLPDDGTYTLLSKPQTPDGAVVLSEALGATNTAYDAFLFGALGRPNRWAVWIQDGLTLIVVGLAIAFVFQAQQFSLGAEGQLYLGALIAGVVALGGEGISPLIILPLAVIAAMGAGFLWGLLPGALKAYLGANELVSTLMLNAIAIRFFDLVLQFQLKPEDAGNIASANFPASGQLPVIVGGTQVTIAVFLVMIAVVAVWYILTRTPFGYAIRMVGANLKFARYGGILTRRTIMLSMGVSGAIAGFAGAHLSMGIHRQLIQNISIGLTFEGVVVALLARNNPLVIPFTGLLYAYLRAGAQFMERDADVSFEVVRIIQAAIILLITADALVALFRRRQLERHSEENMQTDVSSRADAPAQLVSTPAATTLSTEVTTESRTHG